MLRMERARRKLEMDAAEAEPEGQNTVGRGVACSVL